MALKIKISLPHDRRGWLVLAFRVAVLLVGVVLITCVSIFSWYYIKYQPIVDERLNKPIFATTAKIFAAPREVRPGQKLKENLIANELREAGYTTDGASKPSPLGTFSQSVGVM